MCDFPECNYAARKLKALTMHKTKVHGSKTSLHSRPLAHSVARQDVSNGAGEKNDTEFLLTLQAHSTGRETVSRCGSTEVDYGVNSAANVENSSSRKRKRSDHR